MKLGNYMYSLANLNTSFKYNNQQLMRSSINAINRNVSRNMKKNQVDGVVNNISYDLGKKINANKDMLSSIKTLKGKEIRTLEAKNNVLEFVEGSYYKVKAKSGMTVILKDEKNGVINMPYDDLNLEPGYGLAPSDYKEIRDTEQFFSFLLRDRSGYCAYSSYSKTEIKEMLDKVDIKPGWFEIKSTGKSNKFYMLDDGIIYPEYQVEAHRGALNGKNYFKEGYTKDSKFIIDGKEYKLDDNGHLHVPPGTACVMENIKRIK